MNETITNEEIKKALECCASDDYTCEDCLFDSCRQLTKDAIDLINRQQAEIERLKEYENIRPAGCPNCSRGNFSNSKFCSHCGAQLQGKKKEIKAEAIKEFSERLKRNEGRRGVPIATIDNLVKEMVGD